MTKKIMVIEWEHKNKFNHSIIERNHRTVSNVGSEKDLLDLIKKYKEVYQVIDIEKANSTELLAMAEEDKRWKIQN